MYALPSAPEGRGADGIDAMAWLGNMMMMMMMYACHGHLRCHWHLCGTHVQACRMKVSEGTVVQLELHRVSTLRVKATATWMSHGTPHGTVTHSMLSCTSLEQADTVQLSEPVGQAETNNSVSCKTTH
jgi:hypothetical protein